MKEEDNKVTQEGIDEFCKGTFVEMLNETQQMEIKAMLHQYAESRQPTGLVQQEAVSGAVLSEVGSAGTSGQGEGLTVRDAFALAGHAVPEGARIVLPVSTWRYLMPSGDVFYFYEDSRATKTQGWEPTRPYSDHSKFINLANTPAADCLDHLPAPVRAAYLASRSGAGTSEPNKTDILPPPDPKDREAIKAEADRILDELGVERVQAEPSTTPTGVSLQVDKERADV